MTKINLTQIKFFYIQKLNLDYISYIKKNKDVKIKLKV